MQENRTGACEQSDITDDIEARPRARRLPRTAWPKGVSGNPSGRPRAIIHVRDLARQHTEMAVRQLVKAAKGELEGSTPATIVQAANCLLARGWGTPLADGPNVQVNIGASPPPVRELSPEALAILNEARRLVTSAAPPQQVEAADVEVEVLDAPQMSGPRLVADQSGREPERQAGGR
jgi:hypothetical protein